MAPRSWCFVYISSAFPVRDFETLISRTSLLILNRGVSMAGNGHILSTTAMGRPKKNNAQLIAENVVEYCHTEADHGLQISLDRPWKRACALTGLSSSSLSYVVRSYLSMNIGSFGHPCLSYNNMSL